MKMKCRGKKVKVPCTTFSLGKVRLGTPSLYGIVGAVTTSQW